MNTQALARRPKLGKIAVIAVVVVTIIIGVVWVGGNILWVTFGPRVSGQTITTQIHTGMPQQQVRAILGPPHEVEPARPHHNVGELWGYYIEEFGLTAWMNPVYIQFDLNGDVEHHWTH